MLCQFIICQKKIQKVIEHLKLMSQSGSLHDVVFKKQLIYEKDLPFLSPIKIQNSPDYKQAFTH